MKKNIIILLLLTVSFVSFSQNVSQAEYYWDTDPGEGNGTPLLALDGNFDEVIEDLFKNGISISALSIGAHNFSVRVKGQDGNWSAPFTQVIYVDGILSIITRDVKVTQAEYYWNVDPGEGSGTPLLALDGNFDEVIEDLFALGVPTTSLSGGAHNFSVRVKGQDGTWSAPFTQTIFINGGTTDINNEEEIISVKVYPNPVSNQLNVEIQNNKETDFNVKLIDITGKIMMNTQLKNNSFIDVSSFAKGTYSLLIEVNSKVIAKRIIID